MSVSPATILALLATLAVGGIVALQPPLNAELGRRTSVLAAAFISALVTLVLLALIFAIWGAPGSLQGLKGTPLIYYGGGVAGALWVAVTIVTVKELGAGGLVAAAISAQLIVGAVVDELGVLGLERIALSPLRVVGFVALLVGTVLVTLR